MEKMKIAIDVDEVVAKTIGRYMDFIGSKGYRKVEFEDICSYNLDEVLGIKKELMIKLWLDFFEEVEGVEVVDGAKKGVDYLNKKYGVYVITARSKNISRVTRDFIFENFRILGDRVLFSGDRSNGQGKTKDEFCRELGISLIIEDCGGDSLKYASTGLKVLLLDKPWNQGFEHENITRCFCWGEILEKIEEIDNEEK